MTFGLALQRAREHHALSRTCLASQLGCSLNDVIELEEDGPAARVLREKWRKPLEYFFPKLPG